LKFSEKELAIGKQVIKEINARLSFLNEVGLGYLTLARQYLIGWRSATY
jgi:excinuclease ABC subunit A